MFRTRTLAGIGLLLLFPLPALATKNFAGDGLVELLIVMAGVLLSTVVSIVTALVVAASRRTGGWLLPIVSLVTSLPLLGVAIFLVEIPSIVHSSLLVTLCIWATLFVGIRRRS